MLVRTIAYNPCRLLGSKDGRRNCWISSAIVTLSEKVGSGLLDIQAGRNEDAPPSGLVTHLRLLVVETQKAFPSLVSRHDLPY